MPQFGDGTGSLGSVVHGSVRSGAGIANGPFSAGPNMHFFTAPQVKLANYKTSGFAGKAGVRRVFFNNRHTGVTFP